MEEGAPSIIDIVAPGQTGLSDEQKSKSFERIARVLRKQMDRTSPIRLSAHLSLQGVSHDCLEKVCAPADFYLMKQGVYFSTEVRFFNPGSYSWITWGVCREDTLLFLARCRHLKESDGECLMVDVQEPTLSNILAQIRTEYPGLSYMALCRRLASAMNETVDSRMESLTHAIADRARLQSFIEDLGKFSS